jgi:hypothetical protein
MCAFTPKDLAHHQHVATQRALGFGLVRGKREDSLLAFAIVPEM